MMPQSTNTDRRYLVHIVFEDYLPSPRIGDLLQRLSWLGNAPTRGSTRIHIEREPDDMRQPWVHPEIRRCVRQLLIARPELLAWLEYGSRELADKCMRVWSVNTGSPWGRVQVITDQRSREWQQLAAHAGVDAYTLQDVDKK